MTFQEIAYAILFFLTVSGVLWGIWWRLVSMVDQAKKDGDTKSSANSALASLALDKLAEHKLHVAETYVSKQGLREAVEPIMDAIQGVKGAVDHLSGRIDGVYQQNHTPRPRSRQP